MDLSIVIVNWNSIVFTMECVASIQENLHRVEYEIIVVDNASRDGNCAALTEAYKSVRFLRSLENIGFARANNLGAAVSSARLILFLNPDTVVLGDAVQAMVAVLDANPSIGAVGGRLLNGDLTLQTSCVQAFPNIANQLLGIEYFKRQWPRLALWKMQALYSEPGAVVEVEVVSGACLMVRKSVFETVAGFSTEYFLYAEEVDLCYKIRRGGWKVYYVNDANIVHLGGQSTKQQGDGFVDIVMRESTFMLLKKFRGDLYARVYKMALLFSAIVRMTILLPLLLLSKDISRRKTLVSAFRKWRNIASWSLTLQRWRAVKDFAC